MDTIDHKLQKTIIKLNLQKTALLSCGGSFDFILCENVDESRHIQWSSCIPVLHVPKKEEAFCRTARVYYERNFETVEITTPTSNVF